MRGPRFYFLVRSFQSFEWFDRCVDSLLSQSTEKFQILFIDDASDYTEKQRRHITRKLDRHQVIFNQERKFSLRNAWEVLHPIANEKAVIVNVDGDDWLAHDHVLERLAAEYKKTQCLLTYGDAELYNPTSSTHGKRISEIYKNMNSRYDVSVEKTKTYRKVELRFHHLRSWQLRLFQRIPQKCFLRPDGSWIQFCEDQAIFFPLLEMAAGRYTVISETLSVYNRQTSLSDAKVNSSGRLLDEVLIRRQKPLSTRYVGLDH
jgi:glycosyltransferase involved in cell wall biosynthesis